MPVPPKRGEAFTIYTVVYSQADGNVFQTNPTIAAGDFKVSTDDSAFTNLDSLPTVDPAGGKQIKLELSAVEMDGEVITVIGSDQVGAEWADVFIEIYTGSGCGTAVEFTYTITDAGTGLPIQGVHVEITTDIAGVNVCWCGETDSFGVARDDNGELPRLDPGTWYFWRNKPGYIFTNPDTLSNIEVRLIPDSLVGKDWREFCKIFIITCSICWGFPLTGGMSSSSLKLNELVYFLI